MPVTTALQLFFAPEAAPAGRFHSASNFTFEVRPSLAKFAIPVQDQSKKGGAGRSFEDEWHFGGTFVAHKSVVPVRGPAGAGFGDGCFCANIVLRKR